MHKKKFSITIVALGVLSTIAFVALFLSDLGRLNSDSQILRIGTTDELPSTLFYLVEGKDFIDKGVDLEIINFHNDEDLIAAFEKEEVSLIGASLEEAIKMFEAQPDIRSIAATSTIYTPVIDEETIELRDTDVFIVREVTLNAMPEEIRKVFEGWFEAVEYAQEHPEESAGIIYDKIGIETDISGYDFLTLRENITIFSYNSGPYSLYNRGKAIQRYIIERDDFEIEEFIDNSIIQEIYK